MASTTLAVVLFLLLFFACSTSARRAFSKERYGQGHQCSGLDRISISRPSRQIESQGGITELWDETDQELQCAGVAAMRNTIRPNSLSLPNYVPTPSLVYIQSGRGLLGISFPGCPESVSEGSSGGDRHQKIHRVSEGMVVALPAGVLHWCYNDDKEEELVAFSITDVKSETNQLDEIPRSFYIAGGEEARSSTETGRSKRVMAGGIPSSNILKGFKPELLSQSLNIPTDLVKKIQRIDGERGLVVRVEQEGGMTISSENLQDSINIDDDGVEETLCNKKVQHHMENPTDVYSKEAGLLSSVNMFKLPILAYLQLSAERGRLRTNAMLGPHWHVNSHVVVYLTRGEGRMQIVSGGKAVLDEQVREGDVVVVPQFHVSMTMAGQDGLDWVSFKTAGLTMRSMVVGRNSIFSGLPWQVVSNSFPGISAGEAMHLKNSRKDHLAIFPSSTS